MGSESDSESVCSGNIKRKDKRESERERERAIYTGSHHKTGVVRSPCTSKGFHYNLTRLQLFKDTSKRLSNAQANMQDNFNSQSQLKETSKCL